jgi:hypothetical protein
MDKGKGKHNGVDWGEVNTDPVRSAGEPDRTIGLDISLVAELQTQLEALKLVCQRPQIILEPQKKISMFSGRCRSDEPSVEEFIREVRETWDLRPHTIKEKLGAILGNVSGPARKEIDCQPPHIRNDPEAILEILTTAFSEVVPVREAEMSFLGSHQKQSESLRAFSHRLFDEYVLATKQQRRERVEPFGEERLRDQFVHGLIDMGLRRELFKLIEQTPSTTFNDVRMQAFKWENQIQSALPTPDQWSERVTSQLAKFGEQLEELKNSRTTMAARQQNNTSQPIRQPVINRRYRQWAAQRPTAPPGLVWTKTDRGFFPYTEAGEPVCTNCWEAGHVARRCGNHPN